MKKYKAKKGARINDFDAQVIGQRIEELSHDRAITPDDLVQDAKIEGSPIHSYFEWNNESAAHQYRLVQARELIRSIVIETKGGETVRAFHNVYLEEFEENKYVSLDKALESEPLWKQVVSIALREANAWKLKYQTYSELDPIVEAIDLTLEKLKEA